MKTARALTESPSRRILRPRRSTSSILGVKPNTNPDGLDSYRVRMALRRRSGLSNHPQRPILGEMSGCVSCQPGWLWRNVGRNISLPHSWVMILDVKSMVSGTKTRAQLTWRSIVEGKGISLVMTRLLLHTVKRTGQSSSRQRTSTIPSPTFHRRTLQLWFGNMPHPRNARSSSWGYGD